MDSRTKQSRRPRAVRPGNVQKMGNVLASQMARRGYGQIETTAACVEAWQQAAGPQMARHSLPGNVRRGVLEVTVRNSTILQELTFQKTQLLAELAPLVPDQNIRDIRFRVGMID